MSAPYYIGRTRVDITYERNFEKITENRVQYFLYLNKTEGALDASNAKVDSVLTQKFLKTFCTDAANGIGM